MKKFKLFASVLCAVMMVVLITGCGGAKNEGEKSKGKCEVFECVEKINATGTIAEVNEIIGFDGEITSQSEEGDIYKWKVYKWQLTEETAIEIRHNENLNILSVEAKFPTSMLKKKDIDWSNVKTDMKAINSKDGLKYADVVKILGGVEGTLTKKDNNTLTYEWYGKSGGSFTARFSTTSGKCTSYNGLF